MINNLTMIYPYYNAPKMLQAQMVNWDLMPEELVPRVLIILVDDGSQEYPALDVVRDYGTRRFDLRLYRVLVDIPWNQHGAKNLAAMEAPDSWFFISDIDHTLTMGSLRRVFDKQDLDKGCFYTVHRDTAYFNDAGEVDFRPMLNKDGNPKPHPNTFLLTKRAYWGAGGYDEDYCGTYGGDGPFVRWLKVNHQMKHLKDVRVVRWPREVISDASCQPAFREAYRPLYGPLFRKKGGGAADRPKDWVRFPWTREL